MYKRKKGSVQEDDSKELRTVAAADKEGTTHGWIAVSGNGRCEDWRESLQVGGQASHQGPLKRDRC